MSETEPRMQFPVDSKVCELLGKANIYFAGLEDVIEFFIWEFATPGQQQMGQAITAEMQFYSILDTTIAVFKVRFPGDQENLKKLESFIHRAQEINRERNAYIHSSYGAGNPGELMRLRQFTKNGKGLVHEFRNITPIILEGHIDKIALLAAQLQGFFLGMMPIRTVHSANDLQLK